MKLHIGETLKKLRYEKDLTQEEAAAHLGISPQSISKWERGEGYPDITMLPAIANYYGVTVDTLLGMHQNEETYRAINDKWTANRQRNLHAENVALMRDALRTFPNDPLLLVQLSASLERLEGTEDEKVAWLRESISVQEQILTYGADSEIRGAVLYNICFSYAKLGETQKALDTALKLPNLYKTRENVLLYFLTGPEKAKNSREALERLAWAVRKHLDALAETENRPELPDIAEQVAQTLTSL